MEKIISNWANIAGIGGIVLAVFLILFYKINLPQGSKKHLTLYMFLVWSVCIFGIFIYFYLQQPSLLSSKEKKEFPEWKTDISITYPENKNEKLISFLKENEGKIIHLSTKIDMSVPHVNGNEDIIILQQVGAWEGIEYPEDPEKIIGIDNFEKDPSLSVPLQGLSSFDFLKLNLINNRKLPVSYGGTGIVMFPIDGYFKVSSLARSGPSTIYELTEIPTNLTITK